MSARLIYIATLWRDAVNDATNQAWLDYIDSGASTPNFMFLEQKPCR
jgi:hypothetical protein